MTYASVTHRSRLASQCLTTLAPESQARGPERRNVFSCSRVLQARRRVLFGPVAAPYITGYQLSPARRPRPRVWVDDCDAGALTTSEGPDIATTRRCPRIPRLPSECPATIDKEEMVAKRMGLGDTTVSAISFVLVDYCGGGAPRQTRTNEANERRQLRLIN